MTVNSQPKRQHHITAAYSEFFATQIKKGSKTKYELHVYDRTKSSWRISQPYNEAVERDFQTIDHFIGLDPYFFEKTFSRIEGLAIEAIKKILQEGRISFSKEAFGPVINLIGIFAGRNLFVREGLVHWEKRRSLEALCAAHRDEATFRSSIGWVLYEYNIGWPAFPSYEESKRFLENGRFKIDVDRSLIVEKMENLACDLVDVAAAHNWMLLEAATGKFITSNKPVNPVWTRSEKRQFPVFGAPDTFIVFPISPSYALLGSWSPLPSYGVVDALVVEGVNWVTANTGATQLFASEKRDLIELAGPLHLQEFHRLLGTHLIEYKSGY
jgi:hypothetical protein